MERRTRGRRAQPLKAVADWAIEPFAVRGGLFLDPFAGSGALCLAAERAGMTAWAPRSRRSDHGTEPKSGGTRPPTLARYGASRSAVWPSSLGFRPFSLARRLGAPGQSTEELGAETARRRHQRVQGDMSATAAASV